MLLEETTLEGVGAYWRDFFGRWPADLRHTGVVVTSFGEQIPFSGFMTNGNLLVVQRNTPDALGAQLVVIPMDNIAALKLVEPPRTATFTQAGFTGAFPKR